MNSSSVTLFSLLRLSLGTSPDRGELPVLTKANWEAIVDLAFEQGVAALMVDGLGSTSSPTGLMEILFWKQRN